MQRVRSSSVARCTAPPQRLSSARTTAMLVTTDGPFVESKEHIGGFYVINADDLDAALVWARKTVEATNHPIEVRPFRATGRLRAACGRVRKA